MLIKYGHNLLNADNIALVDWHADAEALTIYTIDEPNNPIALHGEQGRRVWDALCEQAQDVDFPYELPEAEAIAAAAKPLAHAALFGDVSPEAFVGRFDEFDRALATSIEPEEDEG